MDFENLAIPKTIGAWEQLSLLFYPSLSGLEAVASSYNINFW